MKTNIIALVLIMCTCSVFAQSSKIEYRKILNNGEGLSVKTEPAKITCDGQPTIYFSLMYETAMKENPTQKGFSLFITYHSNDDYLAIPLNGKLLIRTSSGKVISLVQTVDREIDLYESENNWRIVTYEQGKYIGDGLYSIFGKYPISEEDLNSIIEEGIIKVRIETNRGSIECVYPNEDRSSNGLESGNSNIVSHTLLPYHEALLEHMDLYKNF